MHLFRFTRLPSALLMGAISGGLMLVSCASSQDFSTDAQRAPVATEQALEAEATDRAPRPKPQLIKRAMIELQVEQVKAAIKKVSQVVKAQQGDILQSADSIPTHTNDRHQASMELRVPQNRLDPTLEQLAAIGTVQSQSVSAEDVSTQLVDFEARLRNERKSEQMLLKIMERSGSIGDVLKVSQELSKTRANIEQLEAQFKRLQAQVAYSTINVHLEAATIGIPPQRTLGTQLQDAWSQSTRAVGGFTTGLLALGIWLIAFSPYWLGLLLLGAVGRRVLCRRQQRSSHPGHGTTPPAAEVLPPPKQ